MRAKLRAAQEFANYLRQPLPAISIEHVAGNPELLPACLQQSALRLEKHRSDWAIEWRAEQTNASGAQPLWQGYPKQNLGSTRQANDVRVTAQLGTCLSTLVEQEQPQLVVEFGGAFGVSGMYWLAGLKRNAAGKLLSFEPNSVWAEFARQNMASVSQKFELINGTFEDNIDTARGDMLIDIAFIDAIHTSDFVLPQLELVLERAKPGALILLDDIDFSDDMAQLWQDVSQQPRFSAAASIDGRIGALRFGVEL